MCFINNPHQAYQRSYDDDKTGDLIESRHLIKTYLAFDDQKGGCHGYNGQDLGVEIHIQNGSSFE